MTIRTWLFVGDSITHGIRHTHGQRHYVQLVEERVRSTDPETIVINAGIDGGTTATFLRSHSGVIERFCPEVLSVMFGVNDAKAGIAGVHGYLEGLGDIVLRGVAAGATVVVHVPTPVFGAQRAGPRAHLPEYADAARSVGAGAVIVDHPSAWNGVDETRFMDDDIHPNGRGHELVARAMIETMRL